MRRDSVAFNLHFERALHFFESPQRIHVANSGDTRLRSPRPPSARQSRKLSQVAARKFTSGSGLKITLKTASFSFRSECDCCFDFPWPVLRCVWAFPAVVRCESSISEADGRLHYSGLTRDLKRGCKCSKTPSLCCGDHQGRMLACQAVVFEAGRPDRIESPPSFHSGVTASAFCASKRRLEVRAFEPWPSHCERDALPTELYPHFTYENRPGINPIKQLCVHSSCTPVGTIALHYLAAPRGFCATITMLFHRNGNLPAPINRTTRNPASFNSCDRVLRDQNLMCPPSQKGERCASHLLVRARTRFFR